MKPKDQNSSYDGFDTRKIFIPFNSMRRDFPNKPPAIEHSVDRLLVAPWNLETHKDCVRQIRRTLARLHNFDRVTRKPPASGTPSKTRKPIA